MIGLQWKKTHPNKGARQFVPVNNDFDSPVVAGAFKHGNAVDIGENNKRIKLTNDGFHPGVFDHKTKSCVVNDKNKPEEDYYVLTRSSNIQFDWVQESNGNIPTGAIQCGFTNGGDAMYTGRFNCDGRLLCGVINQELKQCEVTVLGMKYVSNQYEVLCLRSVPFGFTYNSLYGLRNSLMSPKVCNMISSKLTIDSSDSPSMTEVFTPPQTPVITRTVTSSQTRSVTVRKVTGLSNGSSSPIRKSPSPEPEPIEESAPSPELVEESAPSPEPVEELPSSPEVVEESAPSPEPVEESPSSPEVVEESAPSPEPAEESAPSPELVEESPSSPELVEDSTHLPVEESTPICSSMKTPSRRRRDSPNTKWQRFGKGFRLVRSPPRFSPLT